MDQLWSHLSTGRFTVKEGSCFRYPATTRRLSKPPRIEQVPNGDYEFIDGKAYQILMGGVAKLCPPTHPLYERTPAHLALFFNLGYDFDERMNPSLQKAAYPNRFGYFRGGDLYVQAGRFLTANESALEQFCRNEQERADRDSLHRPFLPPTDDPSKITTYGLKIPAGHYLALGDNPPVSSDSRDFGMLPEGNLRGSPVWIFWPPGPRWGKPLQTEGPAVNPARAFIWGLGAIGIGTWIIYEKRKRKLTPKWEDL
jgi:signal peptidase I